MTDPTPQTAADYSFEPLTGDGWAINGPDEQERHREWSADGYGLAVALDRETAVLIVDALNARADQDAALLALLEGECLICGHWQPFAVYRYGVGVCDGCRQRGEANRGPCTHARNCRCACPVCLGDPDYMEWEGKRVDGTDAPAQHGCSYCHGFGYAWGVGWSPELDQFDVRHDHFERHTPHPPQMSAPIRSLREPPLDTASAAQSARTSIEDKAHTQGVRDGIEYVRRGARLPEEGADDFDAHVAEARTSIAEEAVKPYMDALLDVVTHVDALEHDGDVDDNCMTAARALLRAGER